MCCCVAVSPVADLRPMTSVVATESMWFVAYPDAPTNPRNSIALLSAVIFSPRLMSSSLVNTQYANLNVDWTTVNVLRPAADLAWIIVFVTPPRLTSCSVLRCVRLGRNLPLGTCCHPLSNTRMDSVVQRAVCVEDTPPGQYMRTTKYSRTRLILGKRENAILKCILMAPYFVYKVKRE